MKKTVIAVFCYKRAGKLRESMEALLKNPECSSMEVIFFCDGPKNRVDEEGVTATRAYIESLSGFKKIEKHFRPINISTGPNFQQGITYLCENYDQFIVVEDDLVVTPNYIRYMLDALDFYRDSRSVFCITGFAFPLNKGNYVMDTVVHTRFCSYGWASWSDRVRKVEWDQAVLLHHIQTIPGFKRQLNTEGRDLSRTLNKQLTGQISTWDIQMQVAVARHTMKVVYPVVSKTFNIGFDSESTNTFGVDYLKTIVDNGERRKFIFCGSDTIEPALQRQVRKPYYFSALVIRKIINTVIKLTHTVKKPVSVQP